MSEKANSYRKVTYEEWQQEGERLFGKNKMKWKFVCPACGHIAFAEDWIKAGAPENTIAFSCVGRFMKGTVRDAFDDKGKKGPCNYAGRGLFRLNPVTIVDGENKHQMFEFAV